MRRWRLASRSPPLSAHRPLLLPARTPARRKRNKSVAARVLGGGVKLLILVLLALCAGGWLYTHRHKKALLENVATLVTSLNESHEQHGELVRSLMTHQEETRSRDAEIQGLRNRLERLTKELTNTHGHVSCGGGWGGWGGG